MQRHDSFFSDSTRILSFLTFILFINCLLTHSKQIYLVNNTCVLIMRMKKKTVIVQLLVWMIFLATLPLPSKVLMQNEYGYANCYLVLYSSYLRLFMYYSLDLMHCLSQICQCNIPFASSLSALCTVNTANHQNIWQIPQRFGASCNTVFIKEQIKAQSFLLTTSTTDHEPVHHYHHHHRYHHLAS